MLRGFILTVHILLALMIVFLVLMQRGKGAEAGAGIWRRRLRHRIRCARHGDIVFEVDRGVRGAVLHDPGLLAYMGTALYLRSPPP